MVSYMQALFNAGLLYEFNNVMSDMCWPSDATQQELERLERNHRYIWTKQPDLWNWIESNPLLSDALDNLLKLSLVRN